MEKTACSKLYRQRILWPHYPSTRVVSRIKKITSSDVSKKTSSGKSEIDKP